VAVPPTSVHAAAAAQHAGGRGPLWFAAVMGLALGSALATALWAWRLNHRALRSCPVCSATAVRSLDLQLFTGIHASVSLECGECGTWRRVATTPAYAHGLSRALRRDRDTILDGIERIVSERRREEIDVLTRARGG
jgi:hypothetical protein